MYTAGLPLSLFVLTLASTSARPAAAAAPSQAEEAGFHTYNLARRGRMFTDGNGMFDTSAFKAEKEHVANKYAHSNARYKRNLEEGRSRAIRTKKRSRRSRIEPFDIAKQSLARRQNSGGSGSVELIDGEGDICLHAPRPCR